MKCPTDGTTLVMSERSGVEIDYCPDCRGVWLDRGELDKILDRATANLSPAPAPRTSASAYAGTPRRTKKKEHWLMELFD
ncbi:MAG: zf-TFIIB domain-containing protein [Aeromicrobium sp.]|uniref:TFIIB-type zinc ribbon-containing protein n=1 Tax=Aeromicrobium sp. TaxID=1871063 RepID=UPI0039E3ED2B